MTIISNILRFLGKEFLNRSLIQQRSAQNSQHFVGTPVQLEVMLNDSHHAICGDGGVYLDSDSSLCRTPKGFDLKMLLNPLKEEFYAPTIFIEKSDLRGWYLHVVGQVDKCLVLVSRIVCDAAKNSRIFLFGEVIRKSYNLVREYAICAMHGVAFANDLILKITSLPYYKIGFNLIDMIESLQVKVSSVKHVVSSLFIRDLVHRALVVYLRLGNVYERRNIRLNFIECMHLYARFCTAELCPPEDAQAKIDGSRVEGKHLPFYLKLFVDSLSSRNVYHMVGKLFEDTRLSSFVDLCEIASRHVLAKAKMIGLVGMRRNGIGQITEAVTVAQLPEHHDEQLVPASEMLHVFVTFVFHYNSIKDSLWQELYELSEDIFSGVHRMTDLLLDCKGSQFKSSPSIFRSKTLYLNNLQTFPHIFSGH